MPIFLYVLLIIIYPVTVGSRFEKVDKSCLVGLSYEDLERVKEKNFDTAMVQKKIKPEHS